MATANLPICKNMHKAETKVFGRWKISHSVVVVSGTFLMSAMVVGITKISGLYLQYFIDTLEESKSDVVAALGLQSSIQLLAGLIVGPLIVKMGSLKVAACGALLTCAGLFLTSFTQDLVWLYIFYTTMAGIGLGMTHMANCTSVQQHTGRYRAISAGFSLSGSGFGYFVAPQITRWSIDEYGERGSFFILAGIILHALPCIVLFWQPKENVINIQMEDSKHDVSNPAANNRSEVDVVNWNNSGSKFYDDKVNKSKIVKAKWLIMPMGGFNLAMVLVILSYTCLGSGAYAVYLYTPTKAATLGISLIGGTMLMSLQGIGDIIGRITGSALGSCHHYAPSTIYIAGYLVAGIACILVGTCTDYWQMATYLVINGFAAGMGNSMHSTTLRDLIGVENFALIYGYGNFTGGVAGIGTTRLIAYFWEWTDKMSLPFVASGSILGMTGLIVLIAVFNDIKQRGATYRLCCKRDSTKQDEQPA